MKDSRTSTHSQRLSSTFEALLEIPEAEITSIPVVKSEQLPIRSSIDIPVSVQELLYGSKAAGVGTSSKPLDYKNEIISSIEEAVRPRKDTTTSARLHSILFQRRSQTYKSLVEKPKNFIKGSEEAVGPKEAQQPSGNSSSLHKHQKKGSRPQRTIRRERKIKRERPSSIGTRLTIRITEFQGEKR
ncbi:hypothetical protein O181_106968 [Austropuccinia psidii MF-1]|uniref:Uncharacterized protein n=1 Tax=Austropuccinia psidii MF-1 TaxID=1389203 RepID=A0A9Q3JRN6_9BASI|nr:hypothetical protein [Austropuccinia psidii MF-1]